MTWLLVGVGLLLLNIGYGVSGIRRDRMSWSVAMNWYAAGVITITVMLEIVQLIKMY
jgi:hypothetical protein